MSNGLVGYFGFGSLVNRHTLRTDYVDLIPARLNGWRRHWQSRTKTLEEQVALLSIHPDPACSIQGLIVIDKQENLPLVDEREVGYNRHVVSPDQIKPSRPDFDDADMPDELYVYVAKEDNSIPERGCLLQSYLDAVMQGFRNEFGDDGVSHFVETTAGFEREIILDRDRPRYPRSVNLSDDEMTLFDLSLRAAGVRGLGSV